MVSVMTVVLVPVPARPWSAAAPAGALTTPSSSGLRAGADARACADCSAASGSTAYHDATLADPTTSTACRRGRCRYGASALGGLALRHGAGGDCEGYCRRNKRGSGGQSKFMH
jgi:hypothetical protein